MVTSAGATSEVGIADEEHAGADTRGGEATMHERTLGAAVRITPHSRASLPLLFSNRRCCRPTSTDITHPNLRARHITLSHMIITRATLCLLIRHRAILSAHLYLTQ